MMIKAKFVWYWTIALFLSIETNAQSSEKQQEHDIIVHTNNNNNNNNEKNDIQKLTTIQFAGDSLCPCLTFNSSDLNPIHPNDIAAKSNDPIISNDLDNFGIGCKPHDLPRSVCTADIPACNANNNNNSSSEELIKTTAECDRSWCKRRWCYIDITNCRLLHKRSTTFPSSDRYYSYATCHDMDSYTKTNRIASLNQEKLRVSFNSNSGGWSGAYSDDGTHFAGPESRWYGPTVNFVREAALRGNFTMELIEPPSFLYSKSKEFFSASQFDLCVYTAALGYTDFCISQYSVTDQRALSSNWFVLSNDPLYLIVFTGVRMSRGRQFITYFDTIFQPFTPSTWYFLILIVCPLMGVLMLWHEYGKEGSAYPKEYVDVYDDNEEEEEDEEDGIAADGENNHSNTNGHSNNTITTTTTTTRSYKTKSIPLWYHIPKAIYISFLSLLQSSYTESVRTTGGLIHLLGITFFFLTILTVYTANLASILTQQAGIAEVDSIEDAIRAGYTFCGERKVSSTVMSLYNIADRFISDPIELGGDGKPGFNCDACRSRVRVFEQMSRSNTRRSNPDSPYCDAAIAPLEDLEVFLRDGKHCDKVAVGDPLTYVQSGLPIFDGVSQGLISLMLNMKNDGIFARELQEARPTSTCPKGSGNGGGGSGDGGGDDALSIEELTGIWVISFGFAMLGLVMKFCFKGQNEQLLLRMKQRKKERRQQQQQQQRREQQEEEEEDQQQGSHTKKNDDDHDHDGNYLPSTTTSTTTTISRRWKNGLNVHKEEDNNEEE